MKCKTIREIGADLNCHPPYVSLNSLGRKVIAPGVVICKDEFPLANCVSLCLNGLAIPEDEECRLACNRTEMELQAARQAMTDLLAGKSLDQDEGDDDESDDFEEDE